VRAFERQPGESTKAFEAFKCYRALGTKRSLQKAAELYYGRSTNVAQFGRWSRKFDWVERARAFDDWQEMIAQQAIAEYEQRRAVEFAERQMALREGLLEGAEQALAQMMKMLRWPLAEQRVLREGENGEDVTYVFVPAKWSKATARAMYEMVAGAVVGSWASREINDEAEQEFDFSEWTDEEIEEYVRLTEKLVVRNRARLGSAQRELPVHSCPGALSDGDVTSKNRIDMRKT
jgi:hypothetical protein